jgi:hypothetical protein
MTTENDPYRHHYAMIKPLGWFLKRIGAARFYVNGSGIGCLFVWWHPLAWPIAALVLVSGVLMFGILEVSDPRWQYANGLRMDPYFARNSIEPHWL